MRREDFKDCNSPSLMSFFLPSLMLSLSKHVPESTGTPFDGLRVRAGEGNKLRLISRSGSRRDAAWQGRLLAHQQDGDAAVGGHGRIIGKQRLGVGAPD